MNTMTTPRLLLAAAVMTALAGCATTPVPDIARNPDPATLPTIARNADGEAIGGPSSAGEPEMTPGSGIVINESLAAQAPPQLPEGGEATFNFEGESLHAVVKAVLGDLLQQNYVIAPTVQGTVTLATPRPVSPAQALSLLEMVLGWNNARLVWSNGRYAILPGGFRAIVLSHEVQAAKPSPDIFAAAARLAEVGWLVEEVPTPPWREAMALRCVGHDGAVRAALQRDDARAQTERVVDQRIRIVQAGDRTHVVQAREAQVATAHHIAHHRPGTVERPQPQPQVGVERHRDACRAGDLDRGVRGVAGLRADGQRDARQVQQAGALDQPPRQLRRPQPARRRSVAKEMEVMACRVVGDEIDRGEGLGIGDHARVVDTLAIPQAAQHRAVGVVTERTDVGHPGALARGGDGEVAAVAAEALQVGTAVTLAGLIELDHRLAEGDDVEALEVGAGGSACRAAGARGWGRHLRCARTWRGPCAATSRR